VAVLILAGALAATPTGSSPSPIGRLLHTMASQKRKRVVHEEEDADSDCLVVQTASDDEFDVDISGALTGKKPRRDDPGNQPENDDDDIEELIHDSIAKRNVKGGTEMLKKIKGKGKSKGDIGGGSFQSMGMCSHSMTILP
jgi:ATP-dependent RNA helicase DDX54/DBP10